MAVGNGGGVLDILSIVSIAALTTLVFLIYEANVWYRRKRQAMTPEQREKDDDDILNMW